MIFRNPRAATRANLSHACPSTTLRASLITPCRTATGIGRGLQRWPCSVVGERRIHVGLRSSPDRRALPELAPPIALVRNGRARLGRRGDRHERQEKGNRE